MAEPIFTFSSYLSYCVKAQNAHSIHSPFVFNLYKKTIEEFNIALAEKLLELRKNYLKDSTRLQFTHPITKQSIHTRISQIAAKSTSSLRFQIFLLQLVDFLESGIVLETGTSLGITTTALSYSSAEKIITVEGADEMAEVAHRYFNKLVHPDKIHLHIGEIRSLFPTLVEKENPDLIFLDADHRSETIHFYLDTIYKQKNQPRCVIVHDIYWSRDMNTAWQAIVKDPRNALTLDLFEAGVIFPGYPTEKQHFVLRF